MGFGTLFIGYFLFLNITYYEFTDLICALVMLMGLIRLSKYNREFSAASAICALFSVMSLVQFIEVIFDTLGMPIMTGIRDSLTSVRYAIIGALSAIILLGIAKIAKQVDHRPLARQAGTLIPFVSGIYTLALLGDLFPNWFPIYVESALVLIQLVITAVVLITLYRAYMGICLSGDNNAAPPPPDEDSKFGFVNEMRRQKNERDLEYAESKQKKAQAKNNKKRKTRK